MQIPRYSLRQLGYFVAIAEAGSIRGACERLHISHAALSQAMDELEQALGAPLLIRLRARGVSLTPAGLGLLGPARALLEAAEELPARVEGVQQHLSGRLTVGCYTTLAPFLIPRLFSGFGKRHPDVELSFVEGSTDEISARMRSGRCEIALLYAFALDETLTGEPLYEVKPHVVLPADHPLAAARTVDLKELVAEPLVLFEVPPASANTKDVFDALGLEPRIGLRTSNFELARAMVARGLGYAVLLQQPAVAVSCEGLPVVTRPIEGYTRTLSVVAARPAGLRQTRRAAAFQAFCRDTLRASPPGQGGETRHSFTSADSKR